MKKRKSSRHKVIINIISFNTNIIAFVSYLNYASQDDDGVNKPPKKSQLLKSVATSVSFPKLSSSPIVTSQPEPLPPIRLDIATDIPSYSYFHVDEVPIETAN